MHIITYFIYLSQVNMPENTSNILFGYGNLKKQFPFSGNRFINADYFKDFIYTFSLNHTFLSCNI